MQAVFRFAALCAVASLAATSLAEERFTSGDFQAGVSGLSTFVVQLQ
jgi:hypothetical protein